MPQDLDIDNYTTEELITLFKLTLPLSETNIRYGIDNSIRKYQDSYGDNREYIDFFVECKNKLINGLNSPKTTILSYDYKFHERNLNPIERRYVTKLLNIDTIFRDGYINTKSTDYLYKLPNPIKNVVSMKISAIELPHAWYAFNKYNNKFNILDSSNSMNSYEYPLGNYNDKQFMNTLAFCDLGLSGDINPHTGSTTLTYNGNTTDNSATIIFCPPGEQYNNTFGWMLGFRKPSYVFNSESSSITSEGAFGSGISKYLFLEVDDYNNNCKQSLISSTNNSTLGNNILGRITISSGHNTLITDNGADLIFKQRDYFGPVTIEKLRIRLLDHFGNVVDLNNNDYSFALEFKQLYS